LEGTVVAARSKMQNVGTQGSKSAPNMRRPVKAADVLSLNSSNEVVSTVLNGMRKGRVYTAVANDPRVHVLISYVRGHIRNLARVLLELRSKVKELKTATVRDIISARHFNAIVSAVKTIAGSTRTLIHVQLASTLNTT
jgi:hypothetical protein